jgi:hypothetical protein
MSTNHLDYSYNAIVVLNNTAVQLMKRRLYTEAVETLKDAIRFMRVSFFPQRSDDGSSSASIRREDLDRALQAAWKRSTLRPSTAPDGIHLAVVTDQSNPTSVYENLERDQKIWFIIEIDPSGSCGYIDYERAEAESSLLLLNYAVAHRCVAKAVDGLDHSTRIRVKETAYEIFDLAQSVGAKLLQSVDPTARSSTALLVGLLSTVHLMHMSFSCAELRHRYTEDLLDLICMISERESILFQPMEARCAAAA